MDKDKDELSSLLKSILKLTQKMVEENPTLYLPLNYCIDNKNAKRKEMRKEKVVDLMEYRKLSEGVSK